LNPLNRKPIPAMRRKGQAIDNGLLLSTISL
jgi:hypothetical protein